MRIDFKKGTHSENDKVILLSCENEAITLDDLFTLIKLFAQNELDRIRVDKVRLEITTGKRPFYFKEAINKAIDEASTSTRQTLTKSINTKCTK